MSGPLAVAGVSAVLKDLLQSGMTALQLGESLQGSASGDVAVSVGAPDRVLVEGNGAFSQLNVFLYNLARNPGWANVDLPSRNRSGDRVSNPMLGVDLYYLITAYGTKDFDAEVLLGGALQVLHNVPGMGRDEIRAALSAGVNLPKNVAKAGLADQIEQIRISPLPMTTEEIVRLWSAFQCNYRPSVAYLVNVVLLQLPLPSRTPLPVRTRQLYATPFAAPEIDLIDNDEAPGTEITNASVIRVTGSNLGLPGLKVLVDGIDVSAGLSLATGEKVLFTLPALGSWPAGLYTGTVDLQLAYPQTLGTPHALTESNVVSFPFVPTPTVTKLVGALRLKFPTPVAARQRVAVRLVEFNPPVNRDPYSYSFDAPDGNGVAPPSLDTLVVKVPVTGVKPATYLVRVTVDGVSSPLTVDASGAFTGPTVAL